MSRIGLRAKPAPRRAMGTCHVTCSAAAVRIAAFAGDRKAAVTFTFDDGTADHIALAGPLLEEFGYRGTFYLVAGWITRDKKTDPAPAAKGDPKGRPAPRRARAGRNGRPWPTTGTRSPATA